MDNGNEMGRIMSAVRNATTQSDEYWVETLRRGEALSESHPCGEDEIEQMLDMFVQEVRDPESDVIIACAYHKRKDGLLETFERLGCAWKEADRAALGRFRASMARGNLAEKEDEDEAATIYVTREDGEVAKVDLPAGKEDDLWTAVDREYPTAWAMLDEADVLCDEAEHEWDVRFRAGEDEELALWLAGAMSEYHGALDDQDATVDAVRSEGTAVVTWTVDGREARQVIALNPGDFERLAVGHDPVAEQWEDGCGKTVCIENAEGGQ